jgi:hypothetical protein
MDKNMENDSLIQVWGKGFRVSIDSEEFQRLVPRERGLNASTLESYLDRITTWGFVLEPLYRLTERELATQKCILFGDQESMAISVGLTEDRHGRESIVLVAVTTRIQWQSGNLAATIAQTHELSSRLAKTYSVTLLRAPEHVQMQLRDGTFLADRKFSMASHSAYDTIWDDIVRGVKTWNGITGIATPSLCMIGANIVIGTRHESERLAANRLSIDGYFDSRERAIIPLSHRITPWQHPSTQNNFKKETHTPEVPIADNPSAEASLAHEIQQSNSQGLKRETNDSRFVEPPYRDPTLEVFSSIYDTLNSIDRTLQSISVPAIRFFEKCSDYMSIEKRKGKR